MSGGVPAATASRWYFLGSSKNNRESERIKLSGPVKYVSAVSPMPAAFQRLSAVMIRLTFEIGNGSASTPSVLPAELIGDTSHAMGAPSAGWKGWKSVIHTKSKESAAIAFSKGTRRLDSRYGPVKILVPSTGPLFTL